MSFVNFRLVTGAIQRSGRGSVLGPDTSRRTRWWELTLDCGHIVERSVRYKKNGRGFPGSRGRKQEDALPPPGHARCEFCKATLDRVVALTGRRGVGPI